MSKPAVIALALNRAFARHPITAPLLALALAFSRRASCARGALSMSAMVEGAAARRHAFGDLYRAGVYAPLAPALFAADHGDVLDGGLAPAFKAASRAARDGASARSDALRAHLRAEAPGVVSFPCFTAAFCATLLAEVEHAARDGAAGPRLARPNGMNRYGLVLNQIGLEPLLTTLLARHVAPLAAALFGAEGARADDHHAFVVRYARGEDVGLDMHEDDSDVTLNVCLGKVFEGATLTFCGALGDDDDDGDEAGDEAAAGGGGDVAARPRVRGGAHRRKSATYAHEVGRAVLHRGRHRHGADDIAAGERVNLILWSTSSAYRATPLYRARRAAALAVGATPGAPPPDRVCLSVTHDRDYAELAGALPSDADAARRGVMLERVRARDAARVEPVHDLARPPEEINELPTLVAFVEAAPRAAREAAARAIFPLARAALDDAAARRRAADAATATPDAAAARPPLPAMLFAMAVDDEGAVAQVRALCGAPAGRPDGADCVVVLDVAKGGVCWPDRALDALEPGATAAAPPVRALFGVGGADGAGDLCVQRFARRYLAGGAALTPIGE